MAINASGPISLGGATTGQSVALELNLGATAQISLNDTLVRTLAGVPSGAITMPTNFYSKSAEGYIGTTVYTAAVATAFSTYTFPSVALTGGDTKIIVVNYIACTTPPPVISTATIAGVSATVFSPNPNPTYAGWERSTIIRVTGVTAQTGNVVLNFAAVINNTATYFSSISISVYTTSKQTTFDTVSSFTSGTSAALSLTANASNRANALVIAGFASNAQVGITGTGLTTNNSEWKLYGNPGTLVNYVSASNTSVSTSFIITSGTMTYGHLCAITVA